MKKHTPESMAGLKEGDRVRFFSNAGCYIDGIVNAIKLDRIHIQVFAGQKLKAGVYCVRADHTDALFVI